MEKKLSVLEIKKILNSETPINISKALNGMQMPPVLIAKFMIRNKRGGR